MPRRILVINGHPDPRAERLASALTDAYVRGANGAGHEIRRIDLGAIAFPPVTKASDVDGEPPAIVKSAQDDIVWAEHVVLVFPLWNGAPPALVKTFFEQVCRYGYFVDAAMKPQLTGRTARLIVTSSISSTLFRFVFSQGTKGIVKATLWSAGIRPTRILSIGNVDTSDMAPRLAEVEKLGARAR